MDVMELLDRLEAMASEARRVPLTAKVMIEEAELFDLIEALRQQMPQELTQAKWVLRDRDRVLAEARTEAERIIGQAKDYVTGLATQSEVLRVAEEKAHETLSKANEEANEVRTSAYDYAQEVLAKFQVSMEKALSLIQDGQATLRKRAG